MQLSKSSASSNYYFEDITPGHKFDLCFMRTTDRMEPYNYTIQNGNIQLTQAGTPENFFGMVQFDERNGDSVFTPKMGNVFPHYCEFTLQQGGKIDGCSKLAVAGQKTGTSEYFIPVWKLKENTVFREDALYKVGIGDVETEDPGYEIFTGTEPTAEGFKRTGVIKGLNKVEQFSEYYLIPHILPEKLVVYYATKDTSEILKWHQELNNTAKHNGQHTLMIGINTPLFRDDEMCIFVTFDADIQWYVNKPVVTLGNTGTSSIASRSKPRKKLKP